MQVPAAEMIEMAAEQLSKRMPDQLGAQIRELDNALVNIKTMLNPTHVLIPFEQGYLLGLEVARMMLALNPAAEAANIRL